MKQEDFDRLLCAVRLMAHLDEPSPMLRALHGTHSCASEAPYIYAMGVGEWGNVWSPCYCKKTGVWFVEASTWANPECQKFMDKLGATPVVLPYSKLANALSSIRNGEGFPKDYL